MKIKESFSRSFLPFGKKVVLDITADFTSSEMLNKAAYISVTQILPTDAIISGVLNNQRGRDAGLILDPLIPLALKPNANEVFYLNASYFEDSDQEHESSSIDFEISLYSKFLSSTRDHGYQFKVDETRNNVPEIFGSKKLREILSSEQIKINFLRIGIFDYRFLNFLPLAPVVYAKFILDLNPKTILMQFTQTGLYSSNNYNREILPHYQNCLGLFELINPNR